MTAPNPFAHLHPMMVAQIKAKLLPPEPVFSQAELANFGEWVKCTGMRPEGARDFNLSKYPYQIPLYDEQRNEMRSRVVIMKAAQTGLTVKLLNRAMWLTADVRRQINVGLGFPTRDAVEQLAASRFKPQLYTSARMIELMRTNARLSKDTVSLMRLGISNMRFLGLVSGVSADSNPLDAILQDETRLIPAITTERFMLRTSESTLRDTSDSERHGARGIIELNSTAGFPSQDIHRYFLDSTQGWWATPCPDHKCIRSRTGIMLAQEFAANPSKVVGQMDSGRYYLRCPSCGARITDDMQGKGFYVHENPGAFWLGFHFSQLVKGEDFLNTDIMPAWTRGINIPEFYNSRLGLPYMDAEAVPASRENIEACCDPLLSWVREGPGRRDGKWRAIGVDQRAPEKHFVIKSLDEQGLEVFERVGVLESSGEEAARDIVRLFHEHGCTIAVIDGEPSYDLAIMVARALPAGTVWFSDYAEGQDDIINWVDKRQDKRTKKSTGEVKHRYRVLVDRYKGIDWSLGMIERRRVRMPNRADLYELRQKRTTGGVVGWTSVADEFVQHLSGTARYKEQAMMTVNGARTPMPGEYKLRWRSIEVPDPHFTHANLSASVGLAYRGRSGRIHFSDPDPVRDAGPLEAGLEKGARPSEINRAVAQATADTCSSCRFFKQETETGGICAHPANAGRRLAVRLASPKCGEYRRLK